MAKGLEKVIVAARFHKVGNVTRLRIATKFFENVLSGFN